MQGDTFDSQRDLAVAARRGGQRGKALEHFRAADALRPNAPLNVLDMVVELIELNRLDEARDAAYALAEARPDLPFGWKAFALLARKRGDRPEALQQFRAASERTPNDAWLKNEVLVELLELGRLDEARDAARALAEARPDLPFGWRGLAIVARKRGDRAEALQQFRAASDRTPNDAWLKNEVLVELIELGRLDEARDVAHALAEARPDLPFGWRGLAIVARRRGDRPEALQQFRAASDRTPNDAWLKNEVLVELIELNRLDEARDAARALAEARPDLPFGWKALGLLARRRGDRTEALQQFRAASDRTPNDAWLKNEVLVELLELGRLDEARDVAHALAEARPDLPFGWKALADLARRRGEREEALGHMRRAAELAPQDLYLHASVAAELRELQRFAEAETYARDLAALHPQSALALTALAQCSRWRLTAAQTLALFEQAVAAEPASLHARVALGAEYVILWRLDEAERTYDTILATDKANLAALIGKAQVARRRGDRVKSLEILAAAVELAPDSEWASVEYARDLVEAGRPEAAEQALDAILARNPRRPMALIFLGQTARARGEADKARRFFATAVELDGANESAVVELALEEYRAGAPQDARRRLEDLLARRPGCARAHDALADIAQALHEVEAAYAHRRAALDIDGSQPTRRLSLARYEATMGRIEEARALVDDCEARFGVLPDIAFARAQLERTAGEPAAELAALEAARKAFPAHVQTWFLWVQALIEDGEFEKARAAVERPPACSVRDLAYARCLSGQIAWAQRRHADAAAHFAAALDVMPNASWLHGWAAKNALALADVKAVAAHLKAQARNDPVHRFRHSGSAKPMQTLVGQLLDEYRVDVDALARLREADASGDPVAALRRLVAEQPDYTPAAIGLFTALRRQGALARLAPPNPGVSPIPRKIGQFWDADIPPDVERLCEEWRANNPEFQYRRFSGADARSYLAEFGPRGARAAFERAAEPAMKADLFRLAYLFGEGGFYVDADDRSLKPLAEFVPGDCDFVACQEDLGTIGNNFIGAAPRHPVIALALQGAIAAILRGDSDMLWLSTGPALLTRVLARALAGAPAGALKRIRIFEMHDLNRAIAMHCVRSYKQSGKHWVRGAFGNKLQTPGIGDAELAAYV